MSYQHYTTVPHDFLDSLPILWLVTMDLTVLTHRLGVKGTIFPSQRGVV
jgi:hypothetical protein